MIRASLHATRIVDESDAIMIREAKKIRDSRSRSSVLAIMKALGHAMSAVPVDSVIAAGTTLLKSRTHQ